MASEENNDEEEPENKKTVESIWNIPGLKKETARVILRHHKKIAKAHARHKTAMDRVEQGEPSDDGLPSPEEIIIEIEFLQSRLSKLNDLEERLQLSGNTLGKNAILPSSLASLVLELELNDSPPKRKPRSLKNKNKQNQNAIRLPYRRYYTLNKTEIRVGKQAEDNDQLSLDSEHRDSADWWMHASGCPGSHVVIRCHDNQLDDDVILDAAALAARHSKCTGNTIKVSLTRCRNVSKPMGAKSGLVRLNGDIQAIAVDMKKAQSRLDRLDQTVLIN